MRMRWGGGRVVMMMMMMKGLEICEIGEDMMRKE